MNVGAKPSVLVPRSVVAFTPMLQPSADAVRVSPRGTWATQEIGQLKIDNR
jgi:hypothetical protein